jgi:16S rRNA (guanine1516-N2)-methyltransferase
MKSDPQNFDTAVLDGRLCLVSTCAPEHSLLSVDFLGGAGGHRMRYGQEGKNSLLGRACGMHLHGTGRILDLTAGLGGDAFVLACLGWEVTMVERNPLLAELLRDGLNRLQTQAVTSGDSKLIEIGNRLSLIFADSTQLLTSPSEALLHTDVIYLDPMYPPRKKSALVKSEMQTLASLVGKDPDARLLLEPAIKLAKRRVVVKRMLKAEKISDTAPHHSITGKTIRYDVYTGQGED